MKISFTTFFVSIISVVYSVEAFSQSEPRNNPITTAVPFLTIQPDARHGALGSAGAATSPDVYDNYHNPAKLAFLEDEAAIGLSYTPWLSNLVPGINLSYLTAAKRIDKNSSLGASLRYFTLGSIQFTDENGNQTTSFDPNEFAFDAAYSRKLAEKFSMSVSLRFIYSNLTGGQSQSGSDTKPGIAGAVDIFTYYQNDDVTLGETDATLSFGGGISNIGNKMTYSGAQSVQDRGDFLPMNFKIGGGLNLHLDDYNDLAFVFDMNKLLVPTPPIYGRMTPSSPETLLAGKDPNVGVATAIFSSWADAPGTPIRDDQGNYVDDGNGMAQVEDGSVLAEELRELYFGFGVEYWYNKLFAARMGYFTEHRTKGNRKYLSFGVGVEYNALGIDFAYLAPFYIGNQSIVGQSPLANTLQFSLTFKFDQSRGGSGSSSSSGDSF
jgi:hypothetical protein